MTELELQKVVKNVHSNGGTLGDVVHEVTGLNSGDEGFKTAKSKLSQKLTDMRSKLKKMCEEQGIPTSKVDEVLPAFRPGRSSRQEGINQLLNQILD